MVQAAVTGALDFSKGDPRDRQWLRKMRLVTEEIEAKNLQKAAELEYLRDISALSRIDIVGDDYKAISDSADKQHNKILRMMFPWVDFKDVSSIESAVKAMGDSWENQYGKIEDPETQAAIQATVKEMMERAFRASQQVAPKKRPEFKTRTRRGKARRPDATIR